MTTCERIYAGPMPTQKVSVTLAADAIERARSIAGPRGLSAYIDRALQEQLERDERRASLLALLDELEIEDPIPSDVRRRGEARAARLRELAEG